MGLPFLAKPHILTALIFRQGPSFFAIWPHHCDSVANSEQHLSKHRQAKEALQLAMATVVPPPSKRQKRENLEKTQIQQDVTAVAAGPAGSFKARFLDSDGKQMADVIEVPLADASEKNLSLLLNTLLARVCLHCLIEHTNGAHWLIGDKNRKGKNSSHIASEYISQRQT